MYLKFQTNIPLVVTFSFDQPKEYPNKFKPGEMQYTYGVKQDGKEAFLSVTPTLNAKLQDLSPLFGKTLQILKYEDGTKKLWKIMDAAGADITPTTSAMPKQSNAPTTAFLDLTAINARIDKAAEVIKEMDNRLKAMEMQIIVMGNEISELRK